MRQFSIDTLPQKTRVVIGLLPTERVSLVSYPIYDKLSSKAQILVFNSLWRTNSYQTYDVRQWIEIISAIGEMTEEIKLELFPYIFGGADG